VATFHLTDQTGATYEIDAPDQTTALNALSQMQGGAQPSAVAPQPPAPDKYAQAAIDKNATLKAAGVDPAYGAAESWLNGQMLGGLPTVMAGLTTIPSMIEHGTWDPTEGYDYAKAQQNSELAAGQKEQPVVNTLANLAGGVTTGALAGAGGFTMVPAAGSGAVATALGAAGDGAAYGGLSGFLSGEGSGRLSDAATGAAVGVALGGAIPIAGKLVSGNPITSNIAARVAPEQFASRQVAQAIRESGRTPQEIQAALDNATASGQPNYSVADALGKPGQSLASTVVRAPGEGGTQMKEFLDNRQAGQAGDVSSQIAEALGAPQTAAQTTAAMTSQRSADAAANYGAARGSGNPVDVTPAIAAADQILQPGVSRIFSPQSGIADNSIESAVSKAKSYLTDGRSNLSDFDQVLQAKKEIDNIIQSGTPAQQAALIPIKSALDDQLAAASPDYANARDTFRAQSQAIDAVPLGATAAQRGRSADTLRTFGAMSPEEQQGFRVGYSDPIIAKAERTAETANAARPLLNDAQQANLGAMSLHQGPYQPGAPDALAQRINRSNTMFETRARATGGSKTADNLADQAESGIEPSMALHAVSGDVPALLRGGLSTIGRALTGSSPAARAALARALMISGPNADVVGALGPAVASQATRAAIARALGGATFGGAAAGAGLIDAENNSRPQRRQP
jgi:hypothetical protein